MFSRVVFPWTVGEQVGKELRAPTESTAMLSPGPHTRWVRREGGHWRMWGGRWRWGWSQRSHWTWSWGRGAWGGRDEVVSEPSLMSSKWILTSPRKWRDKEDNEPTKGVTGKEKRKLVEPWRSEGRSFLTADERMRVREWEWAQEERDLELGRDGALRRPRILVTTKKMLLSQGMF